MDLRHAPEVEEGRNDRSVPGVLSILLHRRVRLRLAKQPRPSPIADGRLIGLQKPVDDAVLLNHPTTLGPRVPAACQHGWPCDHRLGGLTAADRRSASMAG